MKHQYTVSKDRIKRRCVGKKQTHAQMERLVKKHFRRYQMALGLDRWLFDLHFSPLAAENEDRVCFAQIEADWEYRDGSVTFNIDALVEYRMGPIVEYIVRHELSHCVNAPLANLLEKMMDLFITQITEYQTSHLERLPAWDVLGWKGDGGDA